MGLSRVVVVAQGKGGVGKTSLTANVAGLAAHAGHRVLVVDLDQQGNLSRDLGYAPDDGESLLTAIVGGTSAPVVAGVRPRLDVVPGGPAVGDLLGIAFARAGRGGRDLTDLLHTALGDVVADYDLVLVDTPPGDRLLVEAAMGVASYVVVPTRPDEASLDGLERVAERFATARGRNPGLALLGVALFAVGTRAQRMTAEARTTIGQVLGDAAPVFDAQIRHLESAAVDARRRGLLVHELETAASEDKRARLAALAKGTPHRGLLTRDATGLAADYAALAQEMLARIGQLEATAAADTVAHSTRTEVKTA
ncbi:MAG: ParA family protein [Sporichthyaceae bacterium]